MQQNCDLVLPFSLRFFTLIWRIKHIIFAKMWVCGNRLSNWPASSYVKRLIEELYMKPEMITKRTKDFNVPLYEIRSFHASSHNFCAYISFRETHKSKWWIYRLSSYLFNPIDIYFRENSYHQKKNQSSDERPQIMKRPIKIVLLMFIL